MTDDKLTELTETYSTVDDEDVRADIREEMAEILTGPDETNLNLSESVDKLRLHTQVKRGTGTRDQDTIDVKVRGNEPVEVVEKLNETLELLAETADTARAIQPGGDDGE